MNHQALEGGGYPDLSGPTTKKTHFFMRVFPNYLIEPPLISVSPSLSLLSFGVVDKKAS